MSFLASSILAANRSRSPCGMRSPSDSASGAALPGLKNPHPVAKRKKPQSSPVIVGVARRDFFVTQNNLNKPDTQLQTYRANLGGPIVRDKAHAFFNVERVMVAPAAANPFGGDVVAATTQLYYTGTWSWLRRPHFELAGEPLSRPRGAIFEAAAHTLDAERFLSWARFPLVDVERAADDSLVVRFSDARYRSTGRLDGPVVRLSRDLREESPLE